MATNPNLGLYGISSSSGNYGDANVIALLSDFQYPVNVNNNISASGNVSGNVVIANAWYWGNGINLIDTLYSNANAQAYLPTYSGNLGGTLTTNAQPYINVVGPLVNLSVSSNVDMAMYAINNLATPTQGTDAATKQYVDSIAQGLNVKAAVDLATTGALPGFVYFNGVANDGVGATITGLSLGQLTIDGITATVGMRVLVKDEVSANAPYNGIYLVGRSDLGSTYLLTRTTDFDVPEDIYGGYSYVIGGVANIGTSWINTNSCTVPITIGTTAITFVQFAAAGSYVGGNAISINTGVINALVDNDTIYINGFNQLAANTSFAAANIGNATGTALSVSGNVIADNISTNTGYITVLTAPTLNSTQINATNANVLGNVYANYFIGNIGAATGGYGNANVIAFMPTYNGALGNVTTINTFGNIVSGNALVATGNVYSGNLNTLGRVFAAGNVTGNNLNGNLIYAANGIDSNGYISGNSLSSDTNVTAQLNVIAIGNVFAGNISTAGNISSGNVYVADYLNASNITANSHTISSTLVGNIIYGNVISVAGNITGNYLYGNGYYLTGISGGGGNTFTTITVNSILNGGANSTGNIGNATNTFDTIFAKATSAQYADLAEMYAADKLYTPGTVLEIGGIAEVRESSRPHSTAIAGVVSTQPSYLMNSTITADFPVAVALMGRVPCRVIGIIRKGDTLVSSNIPGVATVGTTHNALIGKALQDYDSYEEGIIEVLVGRV